MEILDKLESSVHLLIAEKSKLVHERVKNNREFERVKNDLSEARETIKALKSDVNRLEKASQSLIDLESGKKEIIDRIKVILSKLDQLHYIDTESNTNGEGISS